MNEGVNTRLWITKAVLWGLVGSAAAIVAVRFLRGLGATTALTDLTPWGLWVGFDVVSGVALAAGGFVVAAAVHVFHLERYHSVLRPAILTAFLGYVAVVVGLLVDLGKPWNIWRPMVNWQAHSALFEVAWCVMLYLTVLALEFAPVVFEGLRWNRAYQLMRRFTLPLVVLGIALSTLHQSSLGTLFVINPNRLHPLWWSPILPAIFLVSAIALGLAMVSLETIVSAWLFHREAEWPLVGGLTRAAAWVLGLYAALRLGDLAWRGSLRYALEGSLWSAAFLFELLLSVVVPILLFSLPSLRSSRSARGTGALLVVVGVVLHRVTVAGLADVPRTGQVYLPALSEVLVSLGVVAGMAIIFLFFVEHLRVWEVPPAPAGHFRATAVDPVSGVRVRGPWLGGPQRAALAWTVGVVAGIALLEAGVGHGTGLRREPVEAPRAVTVLREPRPSSSLHRLVLLAGVPSEPAPRDVERALLLDGDRDGRYVLFEHERHQQRLGGLASCGQCHHRSLALAQGTSCTRCHADMYRVTDTFTHDEHVRAMGGNASCTRCHPAGVAKARASATPCASCHRQQPAAQPTFREASQEPAGFAPGYQEAVHRLCIDCHRRHEAQEGMKEPVLSRCANCHRRGGAGHSLRVREGWTVTAERGVR